MHPEHVAPLQPPNMQLGELADLIQQRQAASADEACVPYLGPADRIPMLVTPRRSPQPRRPSSGPSSPDRAAVASDAGCAGCVPAALALGAVGSGAATDPLLVAAATHGASPQTARSGGAAAFLTLPSPQRLLNSLTAVASGVGGRSQGAKAASGAQTALAVVPTAVVAVETASSPADADSKSHGRRDSGGFSIVRAVASPMAMLSMFG